MGYPGDDGGPPDTRAGAPRRTAVWDDGPDQDWPAQAADGRSRHRAPSGDVWGPAAAPGPPRQPTGPNFPNASTGQPGRPPQPGGAETTGPPGRGRTSHRRAPGPGGPADPRPSGNAEPPRGRDDRNRDSRGRHGGPSRGRGAAQSAAPPPAHEDAWRRPPRRPGDEIQGGTRQPGQTGRGAQTGGSLWSSGAFRTAGPGGRGPVRGYPPAPGAPDPVYPPGQFSPWNSPELRTAAGLAGHTAGLGPDLDEPGYSQLAVSDPSADATATQTWAVLDEADLGGEWTSPPAKPPSQAGPGTGHPGPGTGQPGTGPGPAGAGSRGPFGATDAAAASASWQAGQPGSEPPAGLTGPAGGQRPDPAGPGYPGAPGAPRPGGRLAARRSREAAAMDAAQDTAGDIRSRDTGGSGAGGFDTGGFGTSGAGTADRGSRDTGGFGTGGFGTGGFDTGGFETGGLDTGGFETRGFDAGASGASGAGTADRGSRDTGGFDTGGFDTGGFDTGGFDTGGFGASGAGTADRGSRGTGGFGTGGFDTGGFGTGGFGTGGFDTGGFDTGGFDTGGFETGGFDTGGFEAADTGTGGFGARADSGTRTGRDTGPGGTPPRGSRSAARGRTARKPRKPVSRVKMWLMPAGTLVLVGALITVVYLQFGPRQRGASSAGSASRHPAAAASAVPAGPWKHITTRRDDPTALTLAELFPAQINSGGTTAVRTVQKASGANCAKMVLGGKLQAALRKGGCTQVMRASYLSTGQKIMATIGVLNLANVTNSEQAGQVTGATAFIKQLPAAKGPTRNLMKGTGLEEAEIKGHYLILTWAEFTSLKAPAGPKQRAQLDAFSRALVGSTANISLTSRELLGKPATP